MKLLGLIGSLLLMIWIIGILLLTFHNISKGLFALGDDRVQLTRFFMREFLILIWPLVLASEEGRHALRVIWTGKDDI